MKIHLATILPIITLCLALIASAAGLFWPGDHPPFEVTTVRGEKVLLSGKGIYALDTQFKAPIQRGTDAVTLLLSVPLLAFLTILQRKSLRWRLAQLGVLSYFLYYSASLALGIAYNRLFLVYLLLFSASLYAFILCFARSAGEEIAGRISSGIPRKSMAVFMILAGLSVFVWLIEIVGGLFTGLPPSTLGTYTTEPTFVLDLGIIAPAAFSCAVLLIRKKPIAYVLAPVLLILNSLIGIVVVAQTVAQRMAGVLISVGQFIAFVAVFVAMSVAALFLTIRFLQSVKPSATDSP